MKKSEMIEYLAEVIEPVLYDRFNAHIEATYIIEKLQEKGMMPPTMYISAFRSWDNGWDKEDDK